MPKFKKFIQQSPADYGEALRVSGFYVANEPPVTPNKEPFPHNSALPLFSGGSGINIAIRVASGEFFAEDPLIRWNLINPTDDAIFSEEELYSLTAFGGFEVNLRSETGQLIQALHTGGYKKNEIQLKVDELKNSFVSMGTSGLANPNVYFDYRRFQLEVVATDYYGRTNTGIYFLNNKKPDVTGCTVGLGEAISLRLQSTKNSGLQRLDVYSSPVSDFSVIPQSGASTPSYAYSFDLQDLGNDYINNVTITPPNDSGYFYATVLSDSFGSGEAYYYPSSIKPYTIDPLLFNVKTSGLEGRVFVARDTLNKNIVPQVVGKFLKDLSPSQLTYEIKVIESGNFFDKSDYFTLEPPQIKGIEAIVHGTGTGRLDKRFFDINTTLQDYAYSGAAATPIFSAYQTTGLQWLEHSLILNATDNVAPGFLTGQTEVMEVAIAAGNTESARVFWGGEFNTGSLEYQFNPAGTLLAENIYQATYLSGRTGALTDTTQGVDGPAAGTGGILGGLTGALVATNYSGLVVPEYEPHFVYPVHDFADYEFSVRTLAGNQASPFSDVLKFSSGDIIGGMI